MKEIAVNLGVMLVAICLSCRAAHSQATAENPKSFYPPGFVVESKRAGIAGGGSTGVPRPTLTPSLELPASQDGAVIEVPLQPSPSSTPTGTPVPIIAISAVLSSMNKQEFDDNIIDFTQILQKYDLGAGQIYFVGKLTNMQELDTKLMPLMMRGAQAELGFPPERYGITQTPAWIIHTELGEIVIEGASLWDVINDKGEFVEKSNKVKRIEASPENALPSPSPTASQVPGAAQIGELIGKAREAIKGSPANTVTPAQAAGD